MGCGKEAPHSVPSGCKDKVFSKNPSEVVSFTWQEITRRDISIRGLKVSTDIPCGPNGFKAKKTVYKALKHENVWYLTQKYHSSLQGGVRGGIWSKGWLSSPKATHFHQ